MMEQREKLIELLKEAVENHVCGYCDSFTECEECVAQCEADYLLANGVVVPVRCEDCECGYNWMNEGTGRIGKCAFLIGDNQYVTADGFCNLGERKGGGE